MDFINKKFIFIFVVLSRLTLAAEEQGCASSIVLLNIEGPVFTFNAHPKIPLIFSTSYNQTTMHQFGPNIGSGMPITWQHFAGGQNTIRTFAVNKKTGSILRYDQLERNGGFALVLDDLNDENSQKIFDFSGTIFAAGEISNVDFTRDGEYFVTLHSTRRMGLWSTKDGQVEIFPVNKSLEEPMLVKTSPKANEIVVAHSNGVISFYTYETENRLNLTFQKAIEFQSESQIIKDIDYAPDGKSISIVYTDGTAILYFIDANNQLFLQDHLKTIFGSDELKWKGPLLESFHPALPRGLRGIVAIKWIRNGHWILIVDKSGFAFVWPIQPQFSSDPENGLVAQNMPDIKDFYVIESFVNDIAHEMNQDPNRETGFWEPYEIVNAQNAPAALLPKNSDLGFLLLDRAGRVRFTDFSFIK